MEVIYIVYEQSCMFSHQNVKAFKSEQEAMDYCQMQNQLNKPEYDDWGYTSGIFHGYHSLELI